mmetsp:Transcript_44976/g.95929  ORF Transcript_44976/g.95929 Transcript_44976/m.95929 type:complete len:232 (+) Transcript_44976:27-722(+)
MVPSAAFPSLLQVDWLMRGLAPTIPIGIDVLEVMEGQLCPVRARSRMAPLVADHVEVVHCANAQLEEALLHVEVLPPAMPLELILAFLLAVEISIDGLSREDFQRAIQGGGIVDIAIHEEEAVSRPGVVGVGPHGVPEAVREKDRIRIDFDHPIVLLVSAIIGDQLPGLHENEGVEPGVCSGARRIQIPHPHLGSRNLCCLPASQIDGAPVAEDCKFVTVEDARAHVELAL